MIVQDNYSECVQTHLDVKVNLTLDILEGCIHNCTGCYVNKRGNTVEDDVLSQIPKIQDMFNESGIRFSSIILGPTDIFGSNNGLEVVKNQYIRQAISNCTTVEMVSTLDIINEEIIAELNSIPKKEGFMYGFQIAIDPYSYNMEDLKSKVELLNKFTDPLNFYVVFNMALEKVDIEKISREVKDELNSFVEFLPSYQRFSRKSVHVEMIEAWKKRLSDYDNQDKSIISMTIRDKQQGGPYELNYSLYKGKFYTVPFVYDNAIIPTDKFLIKDVNDIKSWTDIKTWLYLDGLEYIYKTDECSDCSRREVCLNKHVLNYMEHYDITQCVYPRWIKDDNYRLERLLRRV